MTKSRSLLALPVLAVLAAGFALFSGSTSGANTPDAPQVTTTRVSNETADAAGGALAQTNWRETSGSARRR